MTEERRKAVEMIPTPEQEKFIEAWTYHLNQLNSLAFQASVPIEELDALKAKVVGWIWNTPTMKGDS